MATAIGNGVGQAWTKRSTICVMCGSAHVPSYELVGQERDTLHAYACAEDTDELYSERTRKARFHAEAIDPESTVTRWTAGLTMTVAKS